MHDARTIIAGLVLFVGVSTSPLWYNCAFGKREYRLELDPPPNGSKHCVADTESGTMRAQHSRILADWRNTVVREGKRPTLQVEGHTYEYSLSKTCLGCHSNKDRFCDRCHDDTGVVLHCWDCHVVPGE